MFGGLNSKIYYKIRNSKSSFITSKVKTCLTCSLHLQNQTKKQIKKQNPKNLFSFIVHEGLTIVLSLPPYLSWFTHNITLSVFISPNLLSLRVPILVVVLHLHCCCCFISVATATASSPPLLVRHLHHNHCCFNWLPQLLLLSQLYLCHCELLIFILFKGCIQLNLAIH